MTNNTSPATLKRLVDAASRAADNDTEANIGFVCRSLTIATLPHRSVSDNEFQRVNGNVTMSIMAPKDIGLPFGTVPRILMSYLATVAVKTQSREIELGDSMSSFMKTIGLNVTGGKSGDIKRLKNQTTRLFSSVVSVRFEGESQTMMLNRTIASRYQLWWDDKNKNQTSLWRSQVTLSDEFYREITEHPIPVNVEVLKALKSSSMCLDVYCWLTFRMSYLKSRTVVTWASLAAQFGSDYSRQLDFKKALIAALKRVSLFYPQARFEVTAEGLALIPSRTSIGKR